MGKNVRKSLGAIKAELDPGKVAEELGAAEVSEEEGLDLEILRKFKPTGDRFKKIVEREPRSHKVTIRFETRMLDFLKQDAKKLGKPYQTHINDILRTYVAASRETS